MFRRIAVEAVSMDEALKRLESEAPDGYEVLNTEVVSEAKVDSITCSAPTSEGAFGKARHKTAERRDSDRGEGVAAARLRKHNHRGT